MSEEVGSPVMHEGFVRVPEEGGHYPPVFSIVEETLKEFVDNIGPYAMAGVAQFIVVLPVVLILVVGLYAALFGGVFGGMVLVGAVVSMVPQELAELFLALGTLGMPLLMLVCIFGMLFLLNCLLAPLGASLIRAVAAHQRGESGALGFSSPFSTFFQDIFSILIVVSIVSTLSFMGMMACYLPAFGVSFILGFAVTMASLHRMGVFGSLKTVASQALAHPGWHLQVALVYLVIMMVANNVPVFGAVFGIAFHVRAYRKAFGDGTEPVLVASGG